MKTALIIGSGIAGIASAIRLQKKGYQVQVFESQKSLGGKIQELHQDGFRWDKGPSLFTLPHLVDELFELCGENPTSHFNYKKVEKICHYFWEDGVRFLAPASEDDFIQEAAKVFSEPAENIQAYLQNAKTKYELTAPLFLEQSLHKVRTYLNSKALKAVSQILSLDVFKSMNQVNQAYFKNPHLIQLFNRYATYNGSSPYKTPGILSLIPHLEMNKGTYFPEKGMREIPHSLIQLAKRQGVQFRKEEAVKKIVWKENEVIGLHSSKQFYPADILVSNADIYTTYTKLISDIEIPKAQKKQELSSSGIIFYWGINREFPELNLHNLFFSADYKHEFEQCFHESGFSMDPSIYIHISSKENAEDAPSGQENWFVMINTANNTGQDWPSQVAKAKEAILQKLNRMLGCDVSDHIISESHLDPKSIETLTGSHRGALYGPASNSKYAAFLRHPNFKSKLQNLYFTGGSVHPGGGIPLCLNSAKIATNLIPEA